MAELVAGITQYMELLNIRYESYPSKRTAKAKAYAAEFNCMRKKGGKLRELGKEEAEREKALNEARPTTGDRLLLYMDDVDDLDTQRAIHRVLNFHDMIIAGTVLINEADRNHYIMVHDLVSPPLAKGKTMIKRKAEAILKTGASAAIATLAADTVQARSQQQKIGRTKTTTPQTQASGEPDQSILDAPIPPQPAPPEPPSKILITAEIHQSEATEGDLDKPTQEQEERLDPLLGQTVPEGTGDGEDDARKAGEFEQDAEAELTPDFPRSEIHFSPLLHTWETQEAGGKCYADED